MPIVKLSELLGRRESADFLRSVVAGGRYANAYLLLGPAGVGKGTAALSFARAILCEGRPGAAADDACGVCAACRKAADLQHPDLKFLFPVSGEEDKLEKTIADMLQAVREDPLYVFVYERYASIRLSMTRELLRELAYRPFEAERRVVVVRDADRMRQDQYSALLKSLEEPGASTVWVLTTSRPSLLPATIHSRCQRVRFSPLAESVIRDFLASRAEVDRGNAALLAAIAGGSLGRALVLRGLDANAERNAALELLEPAITGKPDELWRAVQAFGGFRSGGREKLRRLVEFHQLWLRDLLRARYGAASQEAAAGGGRAAELRRQAARLSPAEIRRRLLVLEEMLRTIEGNVSPDLAMFSAISRVAGVRFGEESWPRHPTARWDY
ncbi:MAG TPA: AAA family ATPase [Terriglobales bacterium]|nr:AAA family ATPase [Terriglobales bacterium]